MALDPAAKKMNLSIKALLPEAERKPCAPREDGEERPARRRAPRKDDGEISSWNEGGSVSTSLADILANAEKRK